ncbi:MAG: hypothetical protein JO100_12145 [Pseudonocardia sp.]|nr:hypothetical protein [Pseudonocardia sp.]
MSTAVTRADPVMVLPASLTVNVYASTAAQAATPPTAATVLAAAARRGRVAESAVDGLRRMGGDGGDEQKHWAGDVAEVDSWGTDAR